MGYTFVDRVKDTSTSTGTGNFTLSGTAPSGFVDFNTAFGTSNQFFYCIDGGAAEWEVGVGHLSASTTLVRDKVLSSSNAGALVSFSAGTKTLFCTIPAEYLSKGLLTDASTVTIDPGLGKVLILSGSTGRTFGAPGSLFPDGHTILIRWTNTGSSSIIHTLTTGSAGAFRFLGSVSALPPTAAGASDYLMVVYQATDDRWDVVSIGGTITPVVPTIVSVGAEFTSTAAPTATLPGTHALNDILVLVLQSSNENIATPSGYTELGPENGIGVAATAGSNRLAVFWKRDGGSESAPTIADSGDHTYGVMFAVRGCPTTGDPFVFGGNNFKFNTSTAGSGPNSVTWVDNVLVVDVFANSVDNATGQGSGGANSDLSSFTAQFNDGTTDGTGGGIYIASGVKGVAGPVKATTVTWANTSVDLCTRIHFLPANTYQNQNASRGTEIQIFIGSPPDLDDVWIKPTGARKILAQICDGGGSGSGGNTTTTAAGGGGGGGGGYDEAWYNADDLGASVTVHAGKGGAAGTALNQSGIQGVVSEFDKGGSGPLTSTRRFAGGAASAAASADGGNGGCGSGRGLNSVLVATTRIDLTAATAGAALGGVGGRGGSGTTSPVGGSPADWGGGGGESGGDTDLGIGSGSNGWSLRGGGGGGGGRTTTNCSTTGAGGGAATPAATQGTAGIASNRLPFGGSGGCGGGSSVVTGGTGGFPGGGGGGGGGVAGGFGGAGGHGCVVVTTYF